ncbi:hypothetical protein M409DRAFT_58771 [Zasmidium cellare ATCC 36951]|uniref:Uncharacterized protein n=1 Tax=Zasmidium cellare ATCC 36951 TaxID=1080233 RepID=A0A6A6C6Y5_ZASCE|nr:uncharacterized protein M409DRAFT_58771 [Zasmidium cellare ATCC 36951]KAF2162018.1 hypothetical protein M409DRAFT_58771 [Zasmidium cellare ATCC 36951]
MLPEVSEDDAKAQGDEEEQWRAGGAAAASSSTAAIAGRGGGRRARGGRRRHGGCWWYSARVSDESSVVRVAKTRSRSWTSAAQTADMLNLVGQCGVGVVVSLVL